MLVDEWTHGGIAKLDESLHVVVELQRKDFPWKHLAQGVHVIDSDVWSLPCGATIRTPRKIVSEAYTPGPDRIHPPRRLMRSYEEWQPPRREEVPIGLPMGCPGECACRWPYVPEREDGDDSHCLHPEAGHPGVCVCVHCYQAMNLMAARWQNEGERVPWVKLFRQVPEVRVGKIPSGKIGSLGQVLTTYCSGRWLASILRN